MTLAGATYGFVLASVLVMAAAATAVFWSRSDAAIDEALDAAVRTRTSAAGEIFARELHGDWVDLGYLAQAAGQADLDGIGALMDGMRGDGTRISWIGFAGVDGKVIAASDGLLAGADVSQRPWFRNGLRSGFAGDLHEAVLLAQKLRPEGGDPLRFIDLALPVRTPAGDVIGVVAMHIDAAWAEQMLAETGGMLGIDLYLISNDGTVVMSSGGGAPGTGELRLLSAARAGTETAGRETWPDGRQYFTTLVPNVAYADLPSFGWRLAGRIDATTFRPGLHTLLGSAALAVAVALAALAVLSVLFVRIFIYPVSVLSANADTLASGADIYPPENGSSREVAQLSGALARLQARRTARASRTAT
ncbi:cache domain-containing protein [Poseidonocella sp. HB161398]|uniref:cache domain-containing protein n=1 Tax=Poseidonocella sp. HB161398 TaxID=2320855 RepID=UPI001109BBBF|nr:cache domain-containing protein [Poseidonocella sp. HB161398]